MLEVIATGETEGADAGECKRHKGRVVALEILHFIAVITETDKKHKIPITNIVK